ERINGRWPRGVGLRRDALPAHVERFGVIPERLARLLLVAQTGAEAVAFAERANEVNIGVVPARRGPVEAQRHQKPPYPAKLPAVFATLPSTFMPHPCPASLPSALIELALSRPLVTSPATPSFEPAVPASSPASPVSAPLARSTPPVT